MTWSNRRKRIRRKMSRTIGLNIRGREDPEVYRVCDDVYGTLEKMISANQAIGPFSRHPRFGFEEVAFVLTLLGAPVDELEAGGYFSVDLWISEG